MRRFPTVPAGRPKERHTPHFDCLDRSLLARHPCFHRWGGEATMKKIELTDATKPLADYVKEMDGMSIMII